MPIYSNELVFDLGGAYSNDFDRTVAVDVCKWRWLSHNREPVVFV